MTSQTLEQTNSPAQALEARVTFLNERKLPAVIVAWPGERLDDLLQTSREPLQALRRRYGAVLFRGFGLTTAEEFQRAAALSFASGLRDYLGGVSPRGQVMAGVYESTQMAAPIRIPQHNEMSYLPDPPRELAFFCETEPLHGGETPLADSRTIYALIPEAVRTVFEQAGIAYNRYLYGPRWNVHHRTRNKLVKLHTSWMAAFATQHPAVVEQAVAETGGTVTWDREEGAKIKQRLPAVRVHPETGEKLWFNQVNTFVHTPHSAGLLHWLLFRIAYPNPFRRPFHATLGDGRAIPFALSDAVHDAIEAATVKFKWQRGDLLIVDNFLVTHGRMPYKGPRRILVAIH
jgi:alpha-ketoglutarate-dependent taurine dioxygenase